jgi:hypothetical protein
MWPLHILSRDAWDAARYWAEHRQEFSEEEMIGVFQADKMSKEEGERLLADALQGQFRPPTALEEEISAHPLAFKFALALYSIKRDAGKNARTAFWWLFFLVPLFTGILHYRREEAVRGAVVLFAYGLIGCFAFGYFRRNEGEHAFFKYFGMAICANLAVALFDFVMTILVS